MLKLIRSPAKVCWHIVYNGIFIEACNTKRAGEDRLREFKRKYGGVIC